MSDSETNRNGKSTLMLVLLIIGAAVGLAGLFEVRVGQIFSEIHRLDRRIDEHCGRERP